MALVDRETMTFGNVEALAPETMPYYSVGALVLAASTFFFGASFCASILEQKRHIQLLLYQLIIYYIAHSGIFTILVVFSTYTVMYVDFLDSSNSSKFIR